MNLQTLSTIAGLLSLGVTLFAGVIAAFYRGRSKADKTASEAQQNAISAMQSELNVLRARLDDAQKENARLGQTLDTVIAAFKSRGMLITIQGEIVNISDGKGSTTTTRIHSTGA